MMGVLEGVVMEISDCALPLVRGVLPTADPEAAFKDVEAAFLVGAMPRKEGMERKDLLSANVKIFKVQVHEVVPSMDSPGQRSWNKKQKVGWLWMLMYHRSNRYLNLCCVGKVV